MTTDDLVVYEMWDPTRPAIPARSRLYHLEPVGVGTPHVESLTSYIVRLAEAHCVRPRTLVTRELVPLLGRPHLAKPADNSLSAFWSKDARALNGTRTLARDWVQVLETLTQRTDLPFLTLLTWADVLPTSRLLRPTRAWCPACYEEWRASGQVVYEPLLWALQVVTACPRHRQRLCLQCPDCQQSLPLLTSRSRPGYCPRCERWLGVSPAVAPNGSEEPPEDELQWQAWVVDTVGELLATTPYLADLPRRESIAAAISVYVERAAGGNLTALARELRTSPCTVSSWRLGRSTPRLQLLLQVCHRFGTPLLRLLTEGARAVDVTKIMPLEPHPTPRRPQAPRRRFDTAGVRRALETVLVSDETPPPAMRAVAKRLGYMHSDLHRHFPDLCRAISARYLAYRKADSRQRKRRLCAEVREAAFKVHAQGLYPSAYRIESHLSVPGFMRHPEAIATWHEVLQELGWEAANPQPGTRTTAPEEALEA